MAPCTLYIMLGYGMVSIVTYAVYAIDKRAAIKDRRRVPEAQLHLLALAGGWPGAWIAQRTLRHKSKKRSFRFVFRITVLLNLTALIGLFMPLAAGLIE